MWPAGIGGAGVTKVASAVAMAVCAVKRAAFAAAAAAARLHAALRRVMGTWGHSGVPLVHPRRQRLRDGNMKSNQTHHT